MNLHPVILSGGAGTRLWPVSRVSCPKQFLPLLKGTSPFHSALERVQRIAGARPPLIVANEEHRFLVLDQMKAAGAAPASLYLETISLGWKMPITATARGCRHD